MKSRRSQVDSIIKLLILSFKNNKNLPFVIPTMICPDERKTNKKCRKKHSEIVVDRYNKNDNTFHLLYYGTHVSSVQFEYDQDEDTVFSMIRKKVINRKYAGKKLIQLKNLKKILKTTKIIRNKRIQVRFSDAEYSSIISKSKRRNLDKSEYIRMELFS